MLSPVFVTVTATEIMAVVTVAAVIRALAQAVAARIRRVQNVQQRRRIVYVAWNRFRDDQHIGSSV